MPLLFSSQPITLILGELSLPSRILKVTDTGISVFRPLHEGLPVQIREKHIRVSFTSSALWILDCPVQEIAHMFIDLNFPPPADMIRIQRRKYLRVPIQMPIRYQFGKDEAWQTGLMLDLSAGGCKLATPDTHEVGEELSIEWEIHGLPVVLPGVIIGKNDGPRGMIYRIQFAIGDRLRESIVKQVFARHRQDIQRGLH